MEAGTEEPAKTRKRGRPRRDDINGSALKAAVDLLVTGGARTVTIERVASEIHATREALYRRWPNAQALLGGALKDIILKASGRTSGAAPYSSQSMPLEDAVRQMIARLTEVFSDPRYSASYVAILAAARVTPEFQTVLETHHTMLLTGLIDALAVNPAFATSEHRVVAKLILSAAVHAALIAPTEVNRQDVDAMANIIAQGIRLNSAAKS